MKKTEINVIGKRLEMFHSTGNRKIKALGILTGIALLFVCVFYGYKNEETANLQAAGSTVVYKLNSYNTEALKASKHEIAEKYYTIQKNAASVKEAGFFVSGKEPTKEKPYSYGTVKKDTLDIMISYANYYRWLQGTDPLPSCTNNETLQAGAYLRGIIFDHNITRAEVLEEVPDMDDDILNKGVGVYNNILATSDPTSAVQAWVNEGRNRVIGHRWFIISPKVSSLKLAYSKFYHGCSLGVGNYSMSSFNSDYPVCVFPNAGYCPRSIYYSGSAAWSFELDPSVFNIPSASDVTIEITNLDTSAVITKAGSSDIIRDSNYGNIFYYNPPDGTNQDCRFRVKITGLTNKSGNAASIVYTTELFDAAAYAETTVSGVYMADVSGIYTESSLTNSHLNSIASTLPKNLSVTCENGYKFTVVASGKWQYDPEADEFYNYYNGSLPEYVTDPKKLLNNARKANNKTSMFKMTVNPNDVFPGSSTNIGVSRTYDRCDVEIDKVKGNETDGYTYEKAYDSDEDYCTVSDYSTSTYYQNYKRYDFALDNLAESNSGDYIAKCISGSTHYYSNVSSLRVGETSIKTVKPSNGLMKMVLSTNGTSEGIIDNSATLLPNELTLTCENGQTYNVTTKSKWQVDVDNKCYYIEADDVTLPRYVNDSASKLSRVVLPYVQQSVFIPTFSGKDVFPGSDVTVTTASISTSAKNICLNKITEKGIVKIADEASDICTTESAGTYYNRYIFTLSNLTEEDSGTYFISYINSNWMYISAYVSLRVGESSVKSVTLKNGITRVVGSYYEKSEDYLDKIASILPNEYILNVKLENGNTYDVSYSSAWNVDKEGLCFYISPTDIELPQYANDNNGVLNKVEISYGTNYSSAPAISDSDVVPGSSVTITQSSLYNSYKDVTLRKSIDTGTKAVAASDSDICTVTEDGNYNTYVFSLGNLKEEDSGNYFITYFNGTYMYVSGYRNLRVGATSVKSVKTVPQLDYIYTNYNDTSDGYMNSIASLLPKKLVIICDNGTEIEKDVNADWYYDKTNSSFALPLTEITSLPMYVDDNNNVLTTCYVKRNGTSAYVAAKFTPDVCEEGGNATLTATTLSDCTNPVLYRYDEDEKAVFMADDSSADYEAKEGTSSNYKDHLFTLRNVKSTDEGKYFVAFKREYYGTKYMYVSIPRTLTFDIPVSGVVLDKHEAETELNEDVALSATVMPKNALNKNISWTPSANGRLYNISGNSATFYAYYAGEYTVTVKTEDGGFTDTCTIKVYDTYATPSAPAKKSVTSDTITLSKVTGVWYSMDKEKWQESNVFTGLDSNTEYTFYAKRPASGYYRESGISEGTTIKTLPVEVTSVTVSADTTEVEKGKTLALTAAVLPANATDKSVTWSSGNENIATVSNDGIVTAKKKGSVVITATSTNGKKGSITITVTGILVNVDFVIDHDTLSINSGDGMDVSKNLEIKSYAVTPVNEGSVIGDEEKTVTFSFEALDNTVVGVTSMGGQKASLKATAPGTTDVAVTATAYDGTKTVKYCKVNVYWKLAAPVVSKDNVTFESDGTTKVSGILYDGSTAVSAEDHKLMYSIDGESFVDTGIFNLEGDTEYTLYVKEVPVNNTYLMASDVTEYSFKTPVIKVSSINADKDKLNLEKGENDSTILTILPENANDKTYTVSLTDEAVCTVDTSVEGTVTFKGTAPGKTTATIASNDGGASTTVEIVVMTTASTPAKPEIEKYNSTSITVKPVEGNIYYKLDNGKWQKSNVFTGLEPETSYTVYVKDFGSEYVRESEVSEGTEVTTISKEDDPDYPSVKVTGISLSKESAKLYVGSKLNVSVSIYPDDADIQTFTYSVDEPEKASVSENSDGTLEITAIDRGPVILKAVSDDGGLEAECAIYIWDKYAKAEAPEALSVAKTGVALKETTGYEYSKDSINWQNSGTFNGLKPGTEYTFYQRMAGNPEEYYEAGEASDGTKVKTKEDTKPDDPVDPDEPVNPVKPTVKKVEMYRLYNPNSGEHFYTSSGAERDNLISAGWKYEGIGWNAPSKSKTPVYRLYNKNAGDHHYTFSAAEKDMLVSVGWIYEGIGWYSDDAKSVPLYRQYNPNALAGSHNYTTSKAENDYLVSVGWKEEGIGWYGMK